MLTELIAETTLAKGASLHVLDGGDIEIAGPGGTLWITVDHDPRDYIVEAGERFSARAGRPCVVHALADTRVRWHATTEVDVVPSPRPAWPAPFAPRRPASFWATA